MNTLFCVAAMYFNEPLPFISSFISDVNATLLKEGNGSLSSKQQEWLCFSMMGLLSSRKLCWKENERNSLNLYSDGAQSWMFRHASIPWKELMKAFVSSTLHEFKITKGSLVIDETDRERSKSTKQIYHLHYLKDKKSGGTVPGQCIVFLLLVTPSISIPVGFDFYMPDPERTKWKKEENRLKKLGVPARDRPQEVLRRAEYPTKQEIGIALLKEFKSNFPDIDVFSVNADALYGSADFLDQAEAIYPQIVSQIRGDQNIKIRGVEKSVHTYFAALPPLSKKVTIRGDKKQKIIFNSARLHVSAHGKKRFIIALKYEGETEFRYLVATDMTWRTHDILQSFFLRWLIEVFFEDWKGHEGWGQFAKHTGEDGSRHGLILSLMFDCCLFRHHDQKTSIKQKLPAYTVASITSKARAESLIQLIQNLFQLPENHEKIEELSESVKNIFPLKISKKHFSGRRMPKLKPSPRLAYKKAA